MPVYLSPGVFPREIDLSAIPASGSGIIPAFVGTAQKGPVNEPTLVTTAASFLETFGEPFVDSNLGYAVLSFMEEGNLAWIMRVGVECEEGQSDALAAICMDTSGAKTDGWGRVALYTGIDFGKIRLRTPSADEPYTFHDASVTNVEYNDIDVSGTDGPTVAALNIISSDYADAIDDVFTFLIISPPTSGVIDGAEYQIIRQSDGEVVAEGEINDAGGGLSDLITIGETGITCKVQVTGSSPIEQDDTFTFSAVPDNRHFEFAVEGVAGAPYTQAATSYTTAAAFVAAFNALAASEEYEAVDIEGELFIRTKVAGERIQLIDSTPDGTEPNTEGWALEVGTTVWKYDIPRSHIVGEETDDVAITTQRDRVDVRVIGSEATTDLTFTIPVSLAMPIQILANYVHNGGVLSGTRYYEAFAIQTGADEYKLAIVTTVDNEFDKVTLLADFSHVETLRFAEELEFAYPYSVSYRGFIDPRVEEPEAGESDDAIPLSCEDNPSGTECSEDTAYFQNLVGFIVAKTPGTWIENYNFTLDNFNGEAGRYTVIIKDLSNNIVDRIDDVSFDPTEARYIGNVVNEGSSIGGQNGDAFYQWIPRSSNIGADETRLPGLINEQEFTGAANGIPADAADSAALDAAIIGNQAEFSGLFAFDNPEKIDISLLVVPGNSSGAVIARGLQICESRGDCLLIVDPPFGLKPQQVVDWHNGMLNTDLTAAINSSYGALYWGWLKIFDQFSSQEIFVPPSGHVTAVFARTERERESWYAPAGLNRGRLLTALDVEYAPTRGERDLLYGLNNAVNPITKFPQEGIVIWGQRTLQRADTALDRVNVRMLLIHLKKVLIPLLRNFLFEQNDEFLWAQVRGAINPVLADIAGRRGLTASKVICDATNNTPATIDRNELHVTILIKPTKVVEFIQLDLAILRSDALFSSEAVLRAAGVTGI